jgi:hypothetical protein
MYRYPEQLKKKEIHLYVFIAILMEKQTLRFLCIAVFSFLLLFYCIYIDLHVYTLFVPLPHPQPRLPGRTCSTLFFSNYVEEKT